MCPLPAKGGPVKDGRFQHIAQDMIELDVPALDLGRILARGADGDISLIGQRAILRAGQCNDRHIEGMSHAGGITDILG